MQYKNVGINIVRYKHKDRHTQIEKHSSEINPHIDGQLVLNKDAQWDFSRVKYTSAQAKTVSGEGNIQNQLENVSTI